MNNLHSISTLCIAIVLLFIGQSCQQAPEVGFSFDKDNVPAETEIRFHNETDEAITYSWDFGDGNTSTLKHPSHTYAKAGIYPVTLVAMGEKKEASITQEITILPPVPIAAFRMDQEEVTAPATIRFTNLSEHADTYEWDFGDGQTSRDVHPNHIYHEPGSYYINLTAIGEGGTHTISHTLVVKDPANVIPGDRAGDFQLGDGWGKLKSHIDETFYNHFLLRRNDGSYIHITTFEETGVSFVFLNNSPVLSSTEPVLLISVEPPFEALTKEGIRFGSTETEMIAAYGPPKEVDPQYNAHRYPGLGSLSILMMLDKWMI